MALPGQVNRHDKRQSEFGGRDGVIQAAADGHELSIAEQAMIMRMHGLDQTVASGDVYVKPGEPTLENAGSGWQDGEIVVDESTEQLNKRLNGRTIDEVTDVETLS